MLQETVKSRLLWLLKPISATILVLWLTHPLTSLDTRSFWLAFSFGIIFGMLLWRETLFTQIQQRLGQNEKVKPAHATGWFLGEAKSIPKQNDEAEPTA